MGAIKELFKLQKSKQDDGNKDSSSNETPFLSTYQRAFGAAVSAGGDPKNLRAGLDALFQSFKKHNKSQVARQKELKEPYITKKIAEQTELKKKELVIDIKEKEIITLNEDIEKCHEEIGDVKHDPEKYGINVDSRPKAQLFIGLSLLIPITIYVIVFYMSASYSAFFKTFDPRDSSVIAAILDGNALSKAYSDGILEAIFVGTIPFVFMGLGYLIHMFQKKNDVWSYLKLALIVGLTFIFDVILAYLIDQSIFEVNASLEDQFSLAIAFTHARFWGIIFAGFIVYLIWGFVFDFVMSEYENVDKIDSFIRSKKNEIKRLKIKIQDLRTQVANIRTASAAHVGKIDELNSQIAGQIIPLNEYLQYYTQYIEAWLQAIKKEIAIENKKKDTLMAECIAIGEAHLKEHNIEVKPTGELGVFEQNKKDEDE